MANIIHKLMKKPTPATIPSLRIITTTLKTLQLSNHNNLTAPPLFPNTTKPDFLNPKPTDDAKPLQFYYPNFPFGFCLNPISTTGLDELKAVEDDVEDDVEDSRTLWADSVKKKRKRKMNKHKYKKLRKRLRRKT